MKPVLNLYVTIYQQTHPSQAEVLGQNKTRRHIMSKIIKFGVVGLGRGKNVMTDILGEDHVALCAICSCVSGDSRVNE
jgi:hypothetical protein